MNTQLFAFDYFSPPGLIGNNRKDDQRYFRFEGCGRGSYATVDDGRYASGEQPFMIN